MKKRRKDDFSQGRIQGCIETKKPQTRLRKRTLGITGAQPVNGNFSAAKFSEEIAAGSTPQKEEKRVHEQSQCQKEDPFSGDLFPEDLVGVPSFNGGRDVRGKRKV